MGRSGLISINPWKGHCALDIIVSAYRVIWYHIIATGTV